MKVLRSKYDDAFVKIHGSKDWCKKKCSYFNVQRAEATFFKQDIGTYAVPISYLCSLCPKIVGYYWGVGWSHENPSTGLQLVIGQMDAAAYPRIGFPTWKLVKPIFFGRPKIFSLWALQVLSRSPVLSHPFLRRIRCCILGFSSQSIALPILF